MIPDNHINLLFDVINDIIINNPRIKYYLNPLRNSTTKKFIEKYGYSIEQSYKLSFYTTILLYNSINNH